MWKKCRPSVLDGARRGLSKCSNASVSHLSRQALGAACLPDIWAVLLPLRFVSDSGSTLLSGKSNFCCSACLASCWSLFFFLWQSCLALWLIVWQCSGLWIAASCFFFFFWWFALVAAVGFVAHCTCIVFAVCCCCCST